MDIVVPAISERLLFDLYGRDGLQVAALMEKMNREDVSIEPYRWSFARDLFDSCGQ